MAYSYVLLSWAEALRAVGLTNPTDPRSNDIYDALYAASEEIQEVLGRHIVQRTDYHWVEYHQRSHSEPHIIRVRHWPIQTDWGSLTIYEDSARDYGATSLLTSGTDYQIVQEGEHTAKIKRLCGDSTTTWLSGYEPIKITLKGGWAEEDIPPPIKRICREFMARQYHAAINQDHAFERVDDARGTVSHFGPVMLTKPQQRTLAEYADHGATTCVRFVEEADS